MKTTTGARLRLQLGAALIVVVSLMVATALPAAAAVTLNPTSGPPGTEVTASGSSASPAAGVCNTVDVYFGATQHSDGHVVSQGTQVASGDCDGVGSYSVPFAVPNDAAKGETQVLVVGRNGDGRTVSEESARFTVM